MRSQQVYKKHFGFYLSQLWLKLQYIVIFYILEIKVKMQWTTCLCSSSCKLREPACPSGLQCINNVVSLGTWLDVIRRNTCMTLRRFLLVTHIPCAQPVRSLWYITTKVFLICNFSENIGDPELHHRCRQSQPEWLCVGPHHPELSILQTPSPDVSGHHHYHYTPKCFLAIQRGEWKRTQIDSSSRSGINRLCFRYGESADDNITFILRIVLNVCRGTGNVQRAFHSNTMRRWRLAWSHDKDNDPGWQWGGSPQRGQQLQGGPGFFFFFLSVKLSIKCTYFCSLALGSGRATWQKSPSKTDQTLSKNFTLTSEL